MLNIDGTPIPSRSYSPFTYSLYLSFYLSFIIKKKSSHTNQLQFFVLHNTDTISFRLFRSRFLRYNKQNIHPVYVRHVDPSVLSFSLSLNRHPHICIRFTSPFFCCSQKKNVFLFDLTEHGGNSDRPAHGRSDHGDAPVRKHKEREKKGEE